MSFLKRHSVTTSETKNAVSTALSAQFAGFNFGVSTNNSTETKKEVDENFEETVVDIDSIGPAPITAMNNASDVYKWINSVTDSNIAYIGPIEGGLMPLYKLFPRNSSRYNKLYDAVGYYLYKQGVLIGIGSNEEVSAKMVDKPIQAGHKCDHDTNPETGPEYEYNNKPGVITKGDGQVGSARGKETYWWIDFTPHKINNKQASLNYKFFVQESRNDRTTIKVEDTILFDMPSGFDLMDGPSRVGGMINYKTSMDWISVQNRPGCIYINNNGQYLIDTERSTKNIAYRFSALPSSTPFINGPFEVRLDSQNVRYDHERVALRAKFQLRYILKSTISY